MQIGQVEQILVDCAICGNPFWYEWKYDKMDCPHCGCQNYRQSIKKGWHKRQNDNEL